MPSELPRRSVIQPRTKRAEVFCKHVHIGVRYVKKLGDRQMPHFADGDQKTKQSFTDKQSQNVQTRR